MKTAKSEKAKKTADVKRQVVDAALAIISEFQRAKDVTATPAVDNGGKSGSEQDSSESEDDGKEARKRKQSLVRAARKETASIRMNRLVQCEL